jgi:hypothetical protein
MFIFLLSARDTEVTSWIYMTEYNCIIVSPHHEYTWRSIIVSPHHEYTWRSIIVSPHHEYTWRGIIVSPHHEYTWRSITVSPSITDLGASCMRIVNFTSRPLQSQGNGRGTRCIGLLCLRADLNITEIFRFARNRTRAFRPVASRYTDWAVSKDRQYWRQQNQSLQILPRTYSLTFSFRSLICNLH